MADCEDTATPDASSTAPELCRHAGGLENVDLWIGGLAEKNLPFGGMLGSTFKVVFEVQMEKLQNSDRFYYLQRRSGSMDCTCSAKWRTIPSPQ